MTSTYTWSVVVTLIIITVILVLKIRPSCIGDNQHLSNTLYKLGKLAISQTAAFSAKLLGGIKNSLTAGYSMCSVTYCQDFPFSLTSSETLEKNLAVSLEKESKHSFSSSQFTSVARRIRYKGKLKGSGM